MRLRLLGALLLAAAGALLAFYFAGPAASSKPAAPRAAVDEETERRFVRLAASMWWHQEALASKLGLDAKQTAKMDRLCLEALRHRHRLRGQVRLEATRFRDALRAGDLEKAEASTEHLAALAADLQVIEHRMILGVLRLLTSPQLEALGTSAPLLLERPWLKTLGGRTGPGPRAGEAAGAPLKDGGEANESARSRPTS